jgi:hypothetical protein
VAPVHFFVHYWYDESPDPTVEVIYPRGQLSMHELLSKLTNFLQVERARHLFFSD